MNGEPPLIMGILNATPDSFSDGGLYTQPEAAVSHILRMTEEGADIIDVGGESTRPGADRIAVDEQLRRTIDIIAECRRRAGTQIGISIDTTRARVAEKALDAGATMINDISAGTEDPDLLSLAAERRTPICLMHMQGEPATMQDKPAYDDVVEDIRGYLLQRADEALKAGVEQPRIILDPGIGFGKTGEHNLRLLHHLGDFVCTGFQILLGASRKRFIRSICATEHHLAGGTCATTALGVQAGVHIFRVHDVAENRQAADVAWAIAQAGYCPNKEGKAGKV